MLAQYFIKIIIPLEAAALVAVFGWFGFEMQGAVVAGVTTLVLSAVWTQYAYMTGVSGRRYSGRNPERIVSLAMRRSKSVFPRHLAKLH